MVNSGDGGGDYGLFCAPLCLYGGDGWCLVFFCAPVIVMVVLCVVMGMMRVLKLVVCGDDSDGEDG